METLSTKHSGGIPAETKRKPTPSTLTMKKTRETRTKSKPALSKKASKDTETPEAEQRRYGL
jgi:hypothetical protein